MTLASPRRVVALLLLLHSGIALAQLSGSASVVSDYRVRGVSLSDGRPVSQFGLAYDDPHGWYGGVFASGTVLRGSGNTEQFLSYAGYTSLIRPGLSWEAGVNSAVFHDAGIYNYSEGFVGLAADRISGRVSYAPNYFGKGTHTLYLEVNGNYPLTDTLRLTGHLGVARAHQPPWVEVRTIDYRADLRVGLNLDVDSWKFQLAWLATQKKHPVYLNDEGGSQTRLTASAGYEF